jgi:hypothetical protein
MKFDPSCFALVSHPTQGAWIETDRYHSKPNPSPVAPHTGALIETTLWAALSSRHPVALHNLGPESRFEHNSRRSCAHDFIGELTAFDGDFLSNSELCVDLQDFALTGGG